MTGRTLTHAEARSFYDRLGSWQDLNRFYENSALGSLIDHAALDRARDVVEFGCGTGRLAERLLQHVLPPQATYIGFDVSATMVALARARIAGFGRRARVQQTEGYPALPCPDGGSDRFLATYVLDLLSDDDARAVTREAHRLLGADGKLCLVSLCAGQTAFSRAVQDVWQLAHEMRPQLVGGCRPVHLLGLLDSGWQTTHREVLCRLGLCSEVVVAEKVELPELGQIGSTTSNR